MLAKLCGGISPNDELRPLSRRCALRCSSVPVYVRHAALRDSVIEAVKQFGIVGGPAIAQAVALVTFAPKVAFVGFATAVGSLSVTLTLASRIYRWIDEREGDIDTASDLLDYGAFAMSACASVIACLVAAGGWGSDNYTPVAIAIHSVVGALLLAFPRRFRIFCGGYSSEFEFMRDDCACPNSHVCASVRRPVTVEPGA